MKEFVSFLFILFAFNVYSADFSALKVHVDAMKPGHWFEIPDTKIPLYSREEIRVIESGGGNIWGYTGSKSVLNAWNGAAFDGYRWWFTGGGHKDYGGNEVYEFDFTKLAWETA